MLSSYTVNHFNTSICFVNGIGLLSHKTKSFRDAFNPDYAVAYVARTHQIRMPGFSSSMSLCPFLSCSFLSLCLCLGVSVSLSCGGSWLWRFEAPLCPCVSVSLFCCCGSLPVWFCILVVLCPLVVVAAPLCLVACSSACCLHCSGPCGGPPP